MRPVLWVLSIGALGVVLLGLIFCVCLGIGWLARLVSWYENELWAMPLFIAGTLAMILSATGLFIIATLIVFSGVA